jgi:ADP-dependent NAD(P)H-hydrate dehydratase / NAD(P)H-hydrate epimerase
LRPLFTAEEMRRLDARAVRELGIPAATLMEHAGQGAGAAVLARLGTRPRKTRRVVIVCGKGGNAGDGFVAARWLRRRGVRVVVVLTSPPADVRGEAAEKLRELQKAGVRPLVITDAAALRPLVARADLVVDALLGTGARAVADGLVADTIRVVNESGRPVLALDVPSGLPPDGGAPAHPVVRADETVTFAGLKRGLVMSPGRELAGRVSIVDIGVPDEELRRAAKTFVLEPADVARHFPRRPREAHKGTYGHLLVVGGSLGKTGAAALTADGALRTGVGLVTVATAASQQPVIAGLVLEAMSAALTEDSPGCVGPAAWPALAALLSGRDAIAIGPGLGLEPATQTFVRRVVVEAAVPAVVDADALTALAGHLDVLKGARAARCLTPHPGEMARLLGVAVADVQRDRIELVRAFAVTHGVHIVLKGAMSVIASPDGVVLLNPTGNPGMASGGTGDVLTGMVGALLARGFAPGDALASAVYLHGLAGDVAAERVGEESLVARDLLTALPAAFERLR